MGKGLEALERLYIAGDLELDYVIGGSQKDDYNLVEKELKQAEKNEKVLNTFKNALTIEHHDISMVDTHDDSEDIVASFVRQLFTIKQNELDKDLRKELREWVLKNAFPKELKALEIIKENLNIEEILLAIKGSCKASDYDLLKEVLLCH